MMESDEFLIGIGQFQLRDLTYGISRDELKTAVKKLGDVLKKRCDPAAPSNQIPVAVWPSELNGVLGWRAGGL